MARPSKSVNIINKNLSKEERKIRQKSEAKIRGKMDKLNPPTYLTESQKEVFKFIKNELQESELLGNLDIFILIQTSICVDRVTKMEEQINNDISLLENHSFMSTKDKYSKDLFRCYNELCLSPQSRAKIAVAASKPPQNKQSLLDILSDDAND